MNNINWQFVINDKSIDCVGEKAKYFLHDFVLSLEEKGFLATVMFLGARRRKGVNMTDLIIYLNEDRVKVLRILKKLESNGYLQQIDDNTIEVSANCIFVPMPF